jgi:Ca-activated chloride channel homolog
MVEEAAMTFAAPAWFWGMLAVPFFIALAFANERAREEKLGKLVAARLRPRLADTVSLARRRLRFLFLLLGFTATVAALARPQWGFSMLEVKRKGRDVLLAIDTSRSMLADDIKPNRLTRAKLAAQDLIAELKGDRVGVIAFAGTAFLQAPLTADREAILTAVNELDTEIIPQGGSNLAGALKAAGKAFGKGESEHRALVIFSDGEELDADANKVIDELKGSVRVFSVGVGTPEGALIPVKSQKGGTEFVKDSDGNVVRSRMDESRMRAVAEETGGFYVHLVSGRAEMQTILRDGLGKMTEHEVDARLSRQPIERYQWPLSLAVVALGIVTLIGERRRGTALPVAAVILAGFPLLGEARNQGVEAFERKDYATARTEFDRQLARQPDRAEMQFNMGSAAYKQGDLDAALGAFSRAVTSPDPALRGKAAYNLGNTLFQRGARQQEKEARKSEWKNAVQHYDEALKVDPKNADAIYNRDLVLKLLEEQDKQQQDQKQDQKDDQKKDQQDKKDKQDQKKDQSKKDDEKKGQQDKQDQQQQQQGDQQKQDQQPQSGNDQQKQDQQQGEQGKEQQNQSQQAQNRPGKEGQKSEQKPQASSGDEKEKDSGGKPGDQKSPSQSPEKNKEQKSRESGDQEKQPPQNADGKKGQHVPGHESLPKKEGELKSTPQYEGEGEEPKDEAAEALAEAQAAAEGKMTPQQARALLESLKSEDDKVRLFAPTEKRPKDRFFKDW